MSEPPVPRPEHPAPQLRRRRWTNLNGWWEFGAGARRRFDRRILVPFAPQAELSGIGERAPGDVLWYRRRFDAPPGRVRLHLGAVDYRATVWVNGEEVARHEGGHTPFAADLAGLRAEGNELVVRAEDAPADPTIPRGKQSWKPGSEGIFYTPTSGIWQTVWLEPLPNPSLESARIDPDLGAGRLGVEVAGDGRVEVLAWLRGAPAGSWSGPAGRGSVELHPVAPWSPGSPALYDLEVRLLDARGRVRDRLRGYFGLRTVEARDGRFLLNGEPFFQRLVLDQGYFPGGLLTAPADADLRRDIVLARRLGFNGARKHQKLEDPRWLHWADRLGFLAWGEMANAQAHSAAAERRTLAEWGEAVVRDRDHPSLVAWAPMNESFGLAGVAPAGRERFLERLYALTHRLDGTRPVSGNDGWEHASTDILTVHDYGAAPELAARYRTLEAALEPGGRPAPPFLPGHRHRGQPLIVSEFGGIVLGAPGGWGYGRAATARELVAGYRAQVEALVGPGPVEGFCYTQLTDVEQERNGLLGFDRRPKASPAAIRAVTTLPKQR